MSIMVENCPRCHAREMTFDVGAENLVEPARYGWQAVYELFCTCKKCHASTIFRVCQREPCARGVQWPPGMLVAIGGALNDVVRCEGFICIRDMATEKPPDHVPLDVEGAFREGATCVSVACFNAAAAMFRLCIDLTTKPMLPKEEVEGLNSRTRRDLGMRLRWLFGRNLLPGDLSELATCIREDGNDGVHVGSLTREDAEDLLEFTVALLERVFSEPGRLRIAEERRRQRRAGKP